ncbi:MAG TPA: Gfo/Idh/MocA family oxidoreductase [Streptosporangiaceae bacterium]
MTSASRPLRFGLVGTGYWARVTHAPALAATEGIELTAVFGRRQEATADLAAAYHATPHHEEAAFLADVDAVAFSVPPDVQAPLAVRAARAGKHLMLEKPIALAEADADDLVDAVEAAGVASVVFFTHRFHPDVRAWLADVIARGGWAGAVAVWLGRAMNPASPFNTPWRREMGGLWDVGPHLVSLLWASLGPVTSVLADAGPVDVTHLILHHQGGASSAVTVTLSAAEQTEYPETYLWGASGRSVAPIGSPHAVTQMRTALTELAANARSGQTSHPCDVRFGREVGRVLAEAQRQIDTRAR